MAVYNAPRMDYLHKLMPCKPNDLIEMPINGSTMATKHSSLPFRGVLQKPPRPGIQEYKSRAGTPKTDTVVLDGRIAAAAVRGAKESRWTIPRTTPQHARSIIITVTLAPIIGLVRIRKARRIKNRVCPLPHIPDHILCAYPRRPIRSLIRANIGSLIARITGIHGVSRHKVISPGIVPISGTAGCIFPFGFSRQSCAPQGAKSACLKPGNAVSRTLNACPVARICRFAVELSKLRVRH